MSDPGRAEPSTPDPRRTRGTVAVVLGALACLGPIVGVGVVIHGLRGSYSSGDAAGAAGLCLAFVSFVLAAPAGIVAALALRKPERSAAGTRIAHAGLALGVLGAVSSVALGGFAVLAWIVNLAAVH